MAAALLVSAPALASPPATEVPDECPPPPEAVAVFVGRVEALDWRSARFSVQQVRAGSVDDDAVGGLIDVDYLEDVRFLELGERYIVGAGRDPYTKRLVSKVSPPAPRFGGNQVVALDELDCPTYRDPVRTLDLDGTSVESGVLTPLYGEGRALLRAVLLPVVWVFGALLAIATLRSVLVWLLRGLMRLRSGPGQNAPRPQRSHSGRVGLFKRADQQV